MKFTDFDFSLTRADNNATLYFKTDAADDLYLYMDSVFSKYTDQTPASWDDIMDRMRYALGKEPDGVGTGVCHRLHGSACALRVLARKSAGRLPVIWL